MQPVFIFGMIQNIRLQSPTIGKAALENLNFNAFGLLPKNVLYSMICSDNMMVRRLAIMKILSIRKSTTTKRLNKIPVIKYDAAHWYELIDLSQPGICEPALTADIDAEILSDAMEKGINLQLLVLPCHSQSVERAVKLTSEASHLVYGQETRHRHIVTKYCCRQVRPSFAFKASYSQSYEELFE